MATTTSLPGHTGGISQTWPSAKGTQRPEREDPWDNVNTIGGFDMQIRDNRKSDLRKAPVDDRGSS
jgi:hypothetical protein